MTVIVGVLFEWGSMSCWNAKRVINASLPALWRVHLGRTTGAGGGVFDPEDLDDLSLGRESGGRVNEIRRCSKESVVP